MPEAAKCQGVYLQVASLLASWYKAISMPLKAMAQTVRLLTSGCVKATISFATTNTLLMAWRPLLLSLSC